ncbi:hypothetical protein LOTGIDRAFT_153363 [Lottia gigantea]|uniref:Uncharacterized protein n=1 Tax=Lottia gigantea TaxID=225164 RepID=V4AK24_LOTGI|nr:hypothetical protein LOTGIDRAFT_153363 [Lottia gigantea]ESO93891.1 hypothetical protein LOTGIDRAFT_153363 [Lottia gigantea]
MEDLSGRTTLALPSDEFRAIEQPTDIITEPSKDNAPGDNIVEDLALVNPENDVTESELPPVPPAELEVRPTRLRQPPQWVQSGEYILSQQPVNFSTSQRRTELARSLLPADFSTLAPDRVRVVWRCYPPCTVCIVNISSYYFNNKIKENSCIIGFIFRFFFC